MADEIAYQNAGQVRQLLAERENAVAYGQDTRVEAIDKQLKQLGVKPPKAKAVSAEPEPEKAEPEGRHSKQEKQHTAD